MTKLGSSSIHKENVRVTTTAIPANIHATALWLRCLIITEAPCSLFVDGLWSTYKQEKKHKHSEKLVVALMASNSCTPDPRIEGWTCCCWSGHFFNSFRGRQQVCKTQSMRREGIMSPSWNTTNHLSLSFLRSGLHTVSYRSWTSLVFPRNPYPASLAACSLQYSNNATASIAWLYTIYKMSHCRH